MQRAIVVALLGLGGLFAQFGFDGPLPPVPVPPANPQTDAKIRLGKQLFFDPRLSADNTISCATCHDPKTGWANHGKVDTGIGGKTGTRNSGSVVDAAYMQFQFWDGRAASLEEQALGPIHNPIEMGETLENVVAKLQAVPGYAEQFQSVFGACVTAERIADAIAAFERTIVTGPSPYDRYAAGERDAISAKAREGADLFNGKAHCSSCHSGPVFSDQSFHNIGIGMDKPNPDLGREAITKKRSDRGRFKTPGLRNVAATFPYLHDGSEQSLRDVLDLYDRGGIPNPDLDPLMVPLALTADEKQALVAFLESLTGPTPQVEPPELPGGVQPVSGPNGKNGGTP
jgi:cytochrome c peroxidase